MNFLVTGGSSGLGASIVNRLADDNRSTVYFTYASSLDAAKRTEDAYPNTKSIHCDFFDIQSIQSLIDIIKNCDLDILINNAATAVNREYFFKSDPEIFRRTFECDVMPTLQITQEALRGFRKKKFGKIINIISSAVINRPPIGWSAYVANKAYLLSMSKSWAAENARFNISVNNISPSFMQTGLTADTDERIIEQMIQGHPLKRLLTTNEVAEAVLFLVNASQQINGTNLIINAGSDFV